MGGAYLSKRNLPVATPPPLAATYCLEIPREGWSLTSSSFVHDGILVDRSSLTQVSPAVERMRVKATSHPEDSIHGPPYSSSILSAPSSVMVPRSWRGQQRVSFGVEH